MTLLAGSPDAAGNDECKQNQNIHSSFAMQLVQPVFLFEGRGSIFGSKNKKKSEEFEPTFHSDPYISIVYMGLSKIGYP